MKAPRLLVLLTLAVSAGLLAGCVAPPSVTSTPTGETVSAQYKRYYEQKLTWKDCGSGMQCATAFAPLDWSAPKPDEDISLALVRHPATGQREGSLFVNPGGPGASGFDFVHDGLDSAVSKALQSRYDVIGWDPRGVGRSSAVRCYDDAQLDKYLFDTPSAPVGSPEYDQQVKADAKAFADACQKRTGKLLKFIDTASTVQDLDMMRAAVGDKKLDYFGYSYGTDIGAHYADRFADKVGRMVLDGATDPTVTTFQMNLGQTEGFGKALRDYLADCLGSSACPFRGSVDDAIAQIRQVLDRLDTAPIRNSDGRKLTGSVVSTAIASALYDQGSWKYLTRAFAEIRSGGSSTAFLLADFYYQRDDKGHYTSNLWEAFSAITCIDYPVETDPTVLAKERDELAAVNPLAEPADLSTLGDVVCEQWPYKFRGTLAPVKAHGAAPIVVVGTTNDPATPYQWARALSQQLESGVLLTYVGEGHIAYDEGDPCIVNAVDRYLTEGTVPKDGLVCNPSS